MIYEEYNRPILISCAYNALTEQIGCIDHKYTVEKICTSLRNKYRLRKGNLIIFDDISSIEQLFVLYKQLK